MRKQTVGVDPAPFASPVDAWFDLERLARVEITSETPENPIEAALTPNRGEGWRASHPGKQIIRLIFDSPLKISHIVLEFEENGQPRTQEFSLHWLSEGQQSPREILRQQFTFSPPGTTQEIEDYRVNLEDLKLLELEIIPDISSPDAYASLAQLRLA